MSLHFRATGFSRRPLTFFRIRRSIYHQPSGLIQIQRVRLRQLWFRRALWTIAAYGIATFVWSEVALRPFDKVDYDALEEEFRREKETKKAQKAVKSSGTDKEEDGTEEDDDDPLFIPLGLPRLVEGEFYSGLDPEWQTFIKISKDKKSLEALKGQLAIEVSEALARDFRIVSRVGAPLKVRCSWLNHEFPYRAPPTYVRSGFEWSENGVKWTSHSLPVEQGDRIWNVLEPFRVTMAAARAVHFYFLIKRTRFENYLKRLRSEKSGQSEDQGQKEEKVRVPYPLTMPLISKVPGDIGNVSAYNFPTAESKADAKRSPFQPLIIHDETSKGEYRRKDSNTDFRAAAGLFLFLLGRSPGRYETPPPGVFIIEGMISLNGPRGQCNVYTKAFFDPKKSHFNTVVNVRSVLPFVQKPRRKN
ncbi:hypothetical protein MferCBS49748_004121 [Microsporum ferrugineum]